jgi:hypothetical protein
MDFGSGQYPVVRVNATSNSAIFGYSLDGYQGGANTGRDWRMEQGRSAAGEFNLTDITAGNLVRFKINSAGAATFAGKTCFDGTLYSDLYAAGSTIQLGNQFFVSEVAANRADMLLGMTLNAASNFESTGTIKPSGIVLQDGSIIFAVDGTTRTVGSAAAATARLTITDTSATFAGSIDVGNDADVTGSATTGYIKLNGNAYNGWISMDASSLHIGHNTSARNLVLETNSTAALTINGSQTAIFAGRFVYRRWRCALLRFYIPTNSRSC